MFVWMISIPHSRTQGLSSDAHDNLDASDDDVGGCEGFEGIAWFEASLKTADAQVLSVGTTTRNQPQHAWGAESLGGLLFAH